MSTLHFDSPTEAIRHFNDLGYTDDFKAMDDHFIALYSRKKYQPHQLIVEYIFRFEGDTDPGNQVELFIIRSHDGIKGSLSMSYSADHNQNVEMIRLLEVKS